MLFPSSAHAVSDCDGYPYPNLDCPNVCANQAELTQDCLNTCNEDNRLIDEVNRDCAKGEQQEKQLEKQQPPTDKKDSSQNPPPSSLPEIKKLEAGRDIKPGQTVTAGEDEILAIDFSGGSSVQVKSGGSFTYKKEKDTTIYETLKGSIRFILEAAGQKKYKVTTPNLVTSVRGTDFVINESPSKTEVLVFSGKLAVADINGQNTVEVPGGFKTQADKFGKPTKPIAFDPIKIDRWFDAIVPEKPVEPWAMAVAWVLVIAVIIGGLAGAFFSIKWILKLLRKRRKK